MVGAVVVGAVVVVTLAGDGRLPRVSFRKLANRAVEVNVDWSAALSERTILLLPMTLGSPATWVQELPLLHIRGPPASP